MPEALRELLEHKIEALDDRIDLRFIELDKALKLQAREYERRLADLNHEQARLLADRERYLPREVFELHQRDDDLKHEAITTFMASNAGRDRGISLSWAVVLAVLSIVVAIASYLHK